jgi:HNH endonuclease
MCGVTMPVRRGRPPKVCATCRPERARERARTFYTEKGRHRAHLYESRTPEYRQSRQEMLGDCSVEGCANGAAQRRDGMPYCSMHYWRLWKHGELGPTERINQVRGGLDPNGYVRLWIDGRMKFEHRHVMERALGRPLRPYENVHHINGIRHDNRPENLEVWVTRQPQGQRPEDLAAWVVEQYPELVQQAQTGQVPHLLPAPDKSRQERIST